MLADPREITSAERLDHVAFAKRFAPVVPEIFLKYLALTARRLKLVGKVTRFP